MWKVVQCVFHTHPGADVVNDKRRAVPRNAGADDHDVGAIARQP